MPLATPGQYARMLDAAAERRYAYAAVNVTSSETLNAALRGFQLADADGIIQITVGAGEYMSGTGANDALLGARALARYAHVVAEASPVLVALHTDHCPPAHVDDWLRPLLAESGRRVALGAAPLFHSHMFDGSALPLADNMRISAELLAACAELDIVLEVECGVVGAEEDGIAGPANGREELYTTPDDLLSVAEALGVGERGRYLVAATFDNVHGTYAPGNVVLRPEILEAGQRALATPIRVHARGRRSRARPLAGRAQGGRRDRRQAQLRPAGVGPRRRSGDGRSRSRSVRGAWIGGSQPREHRSGSGQGG
jgi:fructose-bisphosphate aldolase class II